MTTKLEGGEGIDYTVSNGNFLLTFWKNLLVPPLEDGTNRFSQNFSKKLPLLAV